MKADTPSVQFRINEIHAHSKDRVSRFKALDPMMQGAVFEKLSPHLQHIILEELTSEETVRLLDQFDLVSAENVLARIQNQNDAHVLRHNSNLV